MKTAIFNRNVQNLDVSAVTAMFLLKAQVKNPIDLSVGVPDFDVPAAVKEAACQAIMQGKNRYSMPSGILELREKICKKLLDENGILTNPEQVIVTGAVSGALSAIFKAILNPGDEVLIFDPAFMCYAYWVKMCGGTAVKVQRNTDFSLNFSELEEKITAKTKAAVISTPENPTGKVYSKEELKGLVAVLREKNILLISDEIYEKFCYGENVGKFRHEKNGGESLQIPLTHCSPGSFYDKTITVNGFSKTYAMTGWRIGYCVGPEEVMKQVLKVHQTNFVCAPTPFQYAALCALDTDVQEFVQQQVQRYRKNRDVLYEGLRDSYELVKPQGAFYAFVKYPHLYEGKKFIKDCLQRNLLVVPGNAFAEEDTHFRISFATNEETVKEGVRVLREMVSSK